MVYPWQQSHHQRSESINHYLINIAHFLNESSRFYWKSPGRNPDMKAYLRSTIVIMAINSTTVYAEPTGNIPMVSDIELKAQQKEAMAQIEQQIKSQLSSNMAEHYLLIRQHQPYDKHRVKETIKKTRRENERFPLIRALSKPQHQPIANRSPLEKVIDYAANIRNNSSVTGINP
ncbi:hypothetical protein [Endozoicomonas atrinae]|uniref:hypothetical protein n=1 Tax=Endozoicomonas atrinae TaxID=1333660 RepID=UPI003B00FE59